MLSAVLFFTGSVNAQEKINQGINLGIALMNSNSRKSPEKGISFGVHKIYTPYKSGTIETCPVISFGIQKFQKESEIKMIFPLKLDVNMYLGKKKTRGIINYGLSLNGIYQNNNNDFYRKKNNGIFFQQTDSGFGIWPAFCVGGGVNHSLNSKKQVDLIFGYSNWLYIQDNNWIFSMKVNIHFRN